jgi:hypothetical protein
MTYNFELSTTATLSVTVVEEIVKNAVEQQTGKRVASLSAKYNGAKLEGYDVYFVTDGGSSAAIHQITSREFVATDYRFK